MKICTLFLCALPAFCGLTSITGPLYTPAGDLFGGTITVSLNNPASAQPLYNSDGRTLTGFATRVTVSGGALTLSLEANDAITPAGTSYTARFQPDSATGGGGWAETWVVPTSGSAVQVYALRSTTVPIPSTLFSPSQLTSGGATAGQFLKYSGTSWQPYTYTALTDPTTTTGDIIYRNSGGALTRLGIGLASQVLTVTGGVPTWAAASGGGAVSSVFSRSGAVTAQTGDYTAAQVTGAVDTGGSYADPAWITALAYSKLSGAPSLSGYVAGAAALVTPGAIPFVTAAGEVTEDPWLTYSGGFLTVTDGTAGAQFSVDGDPSQTLYNATRYVFFTPSAFTAALSSDNSRTTFAFNFSDLTVQDITPTTGSSRLIVKAGEGQSGNLQEWQNNAGSALSAITSAGAFTGNAATATALAANPADCAAGQYASAIAASGDLTCAAVAYADVSGTPSLSGYVAGAGNLTVAGAIPYVSAAGTVTSADTRLKWDADMFTVSDGAGSNFRVTAGEGVGFLLTNPSEDGVIISPSTIFAQNTGTFSFTPLTIAASTLGIIGGTSISVASPVVTVQDDTPTTGSTKLIVKAGEGQAGNLQEWQNNAGTALSAITSAGVFTGNASTASALAANPADCTSGQYATTIAASGDLTCAAVAYADVSGTPALATVATSGSASDLGSGTLAAARGGAGTVSGVLKANGSGVVSAAAAGTDYVAPAGNVATATALAANGTNCSAGSYPLGVDASGNAESCTAASGSGTVTSVSVTTANGVSGSVATATSTPAITLTLGAITPASVASVGTVTGSNLSGTNTGDQTTVSGNAGTATVLQTARLINGTSFNGSADITITANLPSNPTACTAGQYVSDIAADGTLTCGTPAGGSGTTQAQALTLVSFRF